MTRERRQLEALRKKLAAHPGVTARVRAAMQHLGKFCYDDLDNLLPAENPKSMRNVIHQFVQDHEAKRLSPGYYEYVPKATRRRLLDVIWHLVRSHRQFTTDEIERLSGAKRYTTLEYLTCLKTLGYLRLVDRGVWHLIDDPGPETPVNTAKCSKLRRLYQTRKEGKNA